MIPNIRLLEAPDISLIANAFQEQQNGERTVLVAFQHDTFCGYLTICWLSNYPPFRVENIPEIVDFNVLPAFRRQGIGTLLMEEAEARIAQYSSIVGIGVGLYADYGAAQRLYVKRGYVPDGRGLVYHDRNARPGEQVVVDDDLVLHFTKNLVSDHA